MSTGMAEVISWSVLRMTWPFPSHEEMSKTLEGIILKENWWKGEEKKITEYKAHEKNAKS